MAGQIVICSFYAVTALYTEDVIKRHVTRAVLIQENCSSLEQQAADPVRKLQHKANCGQEVFVPIFGRRLDPAFQRHLIHPQFIRHILHRNAIGYPQILESIYELLREALAVEHPYLPASHGSRSH